MYYLATNEIDVFHYGELFEGAQVTTGQPVLLYFETKEELISKLTEYSQEHVEKSVDEKDAPPAAPEEN